MSQKKKRFFPITLAVWPYLYTVLLFAFPSTDEELSGMIMWGGMLLSIVLYISHIIYACICKGEDSYYDLAFWNMLIKLIHIPLYIVVFFVGLFFLLTAVVPFMTFVSLFIIICLFISDVFLMITSSMYGVNALIRARREQMISTTYVIINIILQFIFVADVISAVVLYIKLRKKRF